MSSPKQKQIKLAVASILTLGFIPIAYLSLSTDAHLAWPVTLLWFALIALFLDKGDLIADLVESWKQ